MEQNLSLTQVEEMMRTQSRAFGAGITVASGFDLGAKAPLDTRYIVESTVERDAHLTSNRAYEGMIVYVKADGVTYQLKKGNKWEPFGFNDNDFQAGIVNDLTTGGSNKALSAEQGKVLKGLVDANKTSIDELEARHDEEMTAVEGQVATKADKSFVNTELAKKAALAGSREQDFNTKNLVVAGNLTVEGTTTTVGSEDMSVKDNQITLNSGEEGAGVSKGSAGIVVDRGTETNYNIMFDETDDLFKVGMIGDEEIIATRPYVDGKVNPIRDSVATKADASALTAEINRAKGEEAKIRTEFAAADVEVEKKVTANTAAIEAEVDRATKAEQTLTTQVSKKISTSAIANALNIEVEGQVLDARQGKVLDDKITDVSDTLNTVKSTVEGHTTALGTVDSRIATAKTEAIAGAKSYTDTVAKGKANVTHEHTTANITGLDAKLAGQDTKISDLESANTSTQESIRGLQTSVAEIPTLKTTVSKVETNLANEIKNREAADTALGGRIDDLTTTVNGKATKTELTSGLATKVDKSALLDSTGKINTSLMPALALTETFIVESEAEMLRLVAQPGDIAIRTDLSQTFILKAANATLLESWTEFLSPASEVTSVNGMKGAVTLTKNHVGLGNVENESKAQMFTNPTFTGTVTAPTPATGDNSTKVATTAFVKAQGYLTANSVIDGGTF